MQPYILYPIICNISVGFKKKNHSHIEQNGHTKKRKKVQLASVSHNKNVVALNT